MPLESLLELVETLRARIDEHGASLRQNEMRTRYALIDPFLRILGWDTSNPAEVVVEDGSGDGRADYLLLNEDQPVMIIEAKRLGLGVSDGRQQAANYAMDQGRKARYFAVTDGDQWEIYDTHQPAISMLVISFALRVDVPAEVCLKALALWRPAVQHVSIMQAEAPIVGLDTMTRIAAEPVELPASESGPGPHDQPAFQQTSETVTQSSRVREEWILLSELDPAKGGRPRPPSIILFPDNSSHSIQYWNEVTITTIQWLLQNSYLNENHCPIRLPNGTRHVTASKPVHSNGTPFKRGANAIGPICVDLDYTGWEFVRNTRLIIQRVGLNPSQFKVRFSS